MKRFTRDEIASRVARDIPEGSYVNLGIGLPTLVANHLNPSREVFLHSENGILGMGPAPAKGEEDEDLINAGKQPVTLLTGGAYFHHADSFSMMRGGHLDICVLGAFQVSRQGDLANWHTGRAGRYSCCWWRDGSGDRSQARIRHDGTSNQKRREQNRRTLYLPINRYGMRESYLYGSGCD